MVNTVFQITYNILTPVIYLAVYMAVRDNPASPKLQQLSGRDIHKHTRFLVINPVIHTTDASSACFTHSLFNGFQSLIHFHECLSFDTYKLHKLCFFVRHENTGSKSHGQKDVIKRHQMSSDVRDRSVWGSKLKEWLKVCFFTGKTVFLSRTICPKIKKQEIWN